MRVARFRALTHTRFWVWQVLHLPVEMRVARLRALTLYFYGSYIRKTSHVKMRLVRLSTLTRNVRTGREVWDYMGRNVKKRSTTSESEWLEKMNKLELMLEHDYSDVVPMHLDWSDE